MNIHIPKGKLQSPSYHNLEEKTGLDFKYIWCTKCRHGGHLDHIREWFTDLMVCPVVDCTCICLEYNHILV